MGIRMAARVFVASQQLRASPAELFATPPPDRMRARQPVNGSHSVDQPVDAPPRAAPCGRSETPGPSRLRSRIPAAGSLGLMAAGLSRWSSAARPWRSPEALSAVGSPDREMALNHSRAPFPHTVGVSGFFTVRTGAHFCIDADT